MFDIMSILALFVPSAISGIIAIVVFWYQRKGQKVSAMLEVFRILNNDSHRNARESVYCAYHLYKKGDVDIFKREPYRTTAAKVRADMDQMGLLVYTKLVHKEIFLKMYWNTVILCWKALEDDIKRERSDRDEASYMTNFSKLKDWAIEYRDDKIGKKETLIYSDDECYKKFGNMKRNDNGQFS